MPIGRKHSLTPLPLPGFPQAPAQQGERAGDPAPDRNDHGRSEAVSRDSRNQRFLQSVGKSLVCGAVKRPLAAGAILGGYHVRKRLSRDMPGFAVELLEDALAVGGEALITALIATAK